MNQKTKLILIGLIGIILVLGFFFMQTYTAKQQLIKIKQELEKENASLNSRIEKLSSDLRRRQEEVNSLQKGLADLNKAKEELQIKYDSLAKERQGLVEQLKALKTRGLSQLQPAATPQTDDAYWGEVLKAKTSLEFELESVRGELKDIQISNEELQREKSALELDINNLKRDKDDLRRQLDYNQKVTDSISAELAREKNDKLRIEAMFKPLKSENTVLRRQLTSLTNRKINVEKKLVDLQEQKDTLSRRFGEMEAMLKDKMSSIDELREKLSGITQKDTQPPKEDASVELPPIVVRPQADEPSFATVQETTGVLTGTVVAVNRENNFVIIDLGESSGVKAGDTFRVYREGNDIATLEVIKTREGISACDIKKQATPIKVGDLIK
jgi:chromosome segregation ATPase